MSRLAYLATVEYVPSLARILSQGFLLNVDRICAIGHGVTGASPGAFPVAGRGFWQLSWFRCCIRAQECGTNPSWTLSGWGDFRGARLRGRRLGRDLIGI